MCRRRRNGIFQNVLYTRPMYGNAIYAPSLPFPGRPGAQEARKALVEDIIGVIVSRCQQPQGYYSRPPQGGNGYGYGNVQGGYYQGPGNWSLNVQRIPQLPVAPPPPAPPSQQPPINGRHQGLESKDRSRHEHGRNSSRHGSNRHHHRSERREERSQQQWGRSPVRVKQEEVWDDWAPTQRRSRRNPDDPPSYEDVMMNRV